jgi:hypothetical protein
MQPMPDAHPPRVPIEYAGKWIAWNARRTEIIASGTSLVEAKSAAEAAGEPAPILTKAPQLDARFIGVRR